MQEESDDHSEREIVRVSSIARTYRESKKLVNEKEQVRDQINEEELKVVLSQLKITQSQLQKARQNTALLMAKMSEYEDQIEMLKAKIQDLSQKNQQLQVNLELVSEGESAAKKRHLDGDKDLNELVNALKSLQIQNDKLSSDLQAKTMQVEKLKRKIVEGEQNFNKSVLDGQSKALLLLEINDLRATVQRLLYLLKQTDEFNSFILTVQDSSNVHYLKNVCRRIKTNELIMPRTLKIRRGEKFCSCMDIKLDQKYLWAPLDAYRQISEIKRKYEVIDEACIQQILFSLNQIWSARQQAHIKRLRAHHESELNRIRKKAATPFDQIIARKQISRLKKDNAKFRRQKSSNEQYENLKSAGQLEDRIREKDRQIRYLTQKIELIQKQTGISDKGLYLEGAGWMIKKIGQQLNKHKDEFVEFQEQFCSKLENMNAQDQADWIKLYKWLFEGVEELNNGLYEKVKLMQSTTESKMKSK